MSFLSRWLPLLGFRDSDTYWRKRYRLGGNSGEGSYGEPAQHKAAVLNPFVREHGIQSVIEFGCGDGNQLTLADYPAYLGVDISPDAIALCRSRFRDDPSKTFMTLDDYRGESAGLAMSLDVLFHLVEDEVYDAYLERLFAAGERFVVIYSTSSDQLKATLGHVRHRPVEADVSARFPAFQRMLAAERSLPAPVKFGQGLPTRFFFYERSGALGS